MKKKTFQHPEMKVLKLELTDIICTSQLIDAQNESYEEVDEEETNGWY